MRRKETIMRLFVLTFALLCAAFSAAVANVAVSPLFGNHMVLQRNKPVPVVGTASPGETVTVSFGGQQVSATTDGLGNWRVNLASMSANPTPRTMTIAGPSNTITINDILVGDVWVCSGQSNMEWTLGACNRQVDVDTANFPKIRQFRTTVVSSTVPLTTFTGSWSVCSPSTAANFTAIGFYFARSIYRDQDWQLPIGILLTSLGGTKIDPWLAPEGASDIPALSPIYNPGYGAFGLFNGMVYPLAPYACKGLLWYQGENSENAAQTPDSYYLKMKALQQGWASLFEQEDFPFYFVQLAYWGATPTNATPVLQSNGWNADTRLQQTNAMQLPHAGMASALDIGETNDYHPKDKLDVGERLALWALKNDYYRDIPAPSGPILRDAVVSGNKIICSFDYVDHGLMVGSKIPYQPTQEVVGGTLKMFSIAGATGSWYTGTATIVGNTVEVSSDNVQNPTKVAYACWQNPVGANLYNKVMMNGVADGLPASPFYVDDATATGHFTITASAGDNGTISPAGDTTYLKRSTARYTITPNRGYHVQDVQVDGVSVGSVKTYTFDPIYANHTISATFAVNAPLHTVTTTAGPGGSISPAGPISLASGTTQRFNAVPNPGVHVASLTVDGVQLGNRPGFTFSNISKNHSVAATFMCRITASAGNGGTIGPASIIDLPYGGNTTCSISPKAGYAISDVKVDDVSVGAVSIYQFTNVTTSHRISATFTTLPVNVTGKVTDGAGAAISGASVYFSLSPNAPANAVYTATTNATGNYSQSVPVGAWYIAVGKAGYSTSDDKTVTASAGSAPVANFTLTVPPAPGTDVFYKFDETNGTTAADSSGSGKNGTLYNGPAFTSGKAGNCLSFDGINDYVSVPNLGNYGAITIAGWINLDTLGTDSTGSAILACDGSDAGDIQLLILKATGKVRFSLIGNNLADADSNYAFTMADFGKWRHVAVVYDYVAKTVKFYINGGLNATRTLTTTRAATLSGGVRIGAWSGARDFDGKIDDLHIYGRALRTAEIAALVNSSPSMKIADVKKLPDGTLVTLGDKMVTYAPRTASLTRITNYFYIEEPDRSAGILVQDGSAGQDSLNIDTGVSITGYVKTVASSGQKYVELTAIPSAGANSVVTPLGMTTKSIQVDPFTIGMLVRVMGKVVEKSPDNDWFTMTDGFGAPTLVICETGIPMDGFTVGDTVCVTGANWKDALFTDTPEAVIYIRSVVKL